MPLAMLYTTGPSTPGEAGDDCRQVVWIGGLVDVHLKSSAPRFLPEYGLGHPRALRPKMVCSSLPSLVFTGGLMPDINSALLVPRI